MSVNTSKTGRPLLSTYTNLTHLVVKVSILYFVPALIVGVRGRFAGLLLSPAELHHQESNRTLLSSVQRLV